jgi:hypothetical protein
VHISNGFPDSDFRIINQDTGSYNGLCLVSSPWADGTPRPIMRKVQKDGYERWHLRDAQDPWGTPVNLLVSSFQDPVKGYFALARVPGTELAMRGAGSDLVIKMQADQDGYIFPQGNPDSVLTPVAGRDHLGDAQVARRRVRSAVAVRTGPVTAAQDRGILTRRP